MHSNRWQILAVVLPTFRQGRGLARRLQDAPGRFQLGVPDEELNSKISPSAARDRANSRACLAILVARVISIGSSDRAASIGINSTFLVSLISTFDHYLVSSAHA